MNLVSNIIKIFRKTAPNIDSNSSALIFQNQLQSTSIRSLLINFCCDIFSFLYLLNQTLDLNSHAWLSFKNLLYRNCVIMRVFAISLPLNQGYLSTNLDYQPVIMFNRCKFFLCIIYLSIFNQVSSSLHNLIIKFVCFLSIESSFYHYRIVLITDQIYFKESAFCMIRYCTFSLHFSLDYPITYYWFINIFQWNYWNLIYLAGLDCFYFGGLPYRTFLFFYRDHFF